MTLFDLVAIYFPPEEWDRAMCIASAEYPDLPPEQLVGPIVKDDPDGRCYGPFALLDRVWDPSMNPDSPFTREQWAAVLEPNTNVWMASKVWAIAGWRAWDVCPQCEACSVRGGPIPYPRAPLEDGTYGAVGGWVRPALVIGGATAAIALVGIMDKGR